MHKNYIFCVCVFKYPRSVPSRWVWMTWFGELPWASRSWIPRWRLSRWRQCPWPLAACRGRTGLAVQGLPERAWSRLSRGRRTCLCPTDRKPGSEKDKYIKDSYHMAPQARILRMFFISFLNLECPFFTRSLENWLPRNWPNNWMSSFFAISAKLLRSGHRWGIIYHILKWDQCILKWSDVSLSILSYIRYSTLMFAK